MVDWLEIAKGELGVSEISGEKDNPRILDYHRATTLGATHDEIPWCSSFVNWVMLCAAIHGTNSARARSWLNWGKELKTPREGCIVVLKRGDNPSQGHVGFYIGEAKNKVEILSGNQGDKVSIAFFPKENILSYRWPPKMAA